MGQIHLQKASNIDAEFSTYEICLKSNVPIADVAVLSGQIVFRLFSNDESAVIVDAAELIRLIQESRNKLLIEMSES